MSAIDTEVLAYSKANQHYSEVHKRVYQLRYDLDEADEELKKAKMELNRTERELLEKAQQQ